MNEKYWVYIKNNCIPDHRWIWTGKWEIVAEVTCPARCNAVAAIGRKPEWDEIVGCGENRESAYEDAILSEV